MKLITAIIQPLRLEAVKQALAEAGFKGLTISTVEGHGQQAGHSEFYRGAEVKVEFIAKTRIDVLVRDEEEEEALEAIVAAARTGTIGDGKVWSTEAHRVIRVRTGERGPEAV